MLSEDFQKYFMAPTHDNQDLEKAIYNAIKRLEEENNRNAAIRCVKEILFDEWAHPYCPITDKLIKTITTHFYYHWHNSQGTNTEQGFDDWWKTNKQRFI